MWQEEPQFQGYVPEGKKWTEIAEEFSKKMHHVSSPMELMLNRDGSPLVVDVCAFKMSGERLSVSTSETPLSAQFVLCVLKHNGKRVAITF